MATALAAGLAAFIGALVGDILLIPREDGSVIVRAKPYKFLYSKKVDVGTEPVQLVEANAKSFLVKASSTNTDVVFIGNAAVGPNSGYELKAEEAVSMNIDNPSEIFVVAKSGIQTVYVIVLGG